MSLRVCHCISGLHMGGAGRLLLSNVAALGTEDVESTVVSFVDRRDLLPAFTDRGVTVECLDHKGASCGPRTLSRLMRHLQRERIDLVHTHLWLDRVYGGLAAGLSRRPLVTTLHSAGGTRNDLRARVRNVVEDRIAGRTVNRFVAVSNATRDYYVRERGAAGERIDVIHSGVPLEEIASAEPSPAERAALRRRLGANERTSVLLSVGRLSAEKGHKHQIAALPEILHEVPDAILLLVGDGEDRRLLERTATTLGVRDRVRFVGQREDVHTLLYLADLFVFTPAGGEGLGLALLEAMAAARPVIAFRTPSAKEILSEGGGRLVAPTASGDLAREVVDVLSRPDRGGAMGAEGRDIVRRRFDAAISASRLAALYRRVMAEASR